MTARSLWLPATVAMLALQACGAAMAADLAGCGAAVPAMLPPSLRVDTMSTTDILPASDDARIDLSGRADQTFDVLRLDGPAPPQDFRVVAVHAGPATPPSSVLDVDLSAFVFDGLGWGRHRFLVRGCDDAGLTEWGIVSARVSDPSVVTAICVALFTLLYLLGGAAVMFTSRRNPTAEKYPSVYPPRELGYFEALNPVQMAPTVMYTASVQKLQLMMFSLLVGSMVLSLALRTGRLVDLSPTVAVLLGISGVGAATSQAAYLQKKRLSLSNWGWLQKTGALRPGTGAGPRWRDLVTSEQQFDVYKLQTIIFTVAVAAALVADGATRLADFSVPPAQLEILTLSQAVFVGGLLARPSTIADLDTAITALRRADATVADCVQQQADVDRDGKMVGPVPPAAIAVNARAQRRDLALSIVPMIETAFEVDVDPSRL
jgi:hypothetical protein